MPSELLHFPPLYTVVGTYRLLTDPSIRQPVLDKVRHASVRGAIVGLIYAVVSWRTMDWFIARFIVGGQGGFLGTGFGGGRKVKEAVEGHRGGKINVGGIELDLVFYTHMLILLPQLSSILRFFIYKNLKLARSRAYALTVSSRGKPREFWSQGYVEEWTQPPKPNPGDVESGRRKQAVWISWVLWWPVQLFLRHYLLVPLFPVLPLFSPILTSFLRSITTAEYLHQPYFESKGMSKDEAWRWVEERKWAYRAFGFAASLVESIPIAGLFLSIPNRIGAAMMAFDMEKRQHLFRHGVIQPLPPHLVGFYGMGAVHDVGVDIQAAEKEIEMQWQTSGRESTEKAGIELKGQAVGSAQKGRERVL